jgi:regulator of protease activity HflC (stomatin/prohibitin superfamily)
VRNGRTLHEGTAGSFWFRPLGAVISEVPVDDRELPLLFHAQTVDFQDVAVQATVTFRVAEPVVAAQRIDFSVDPDHGRFRSSPLEQVTTILTETAQQYALGIIAALPLTAAITTGLTLVRDGIGSGLREDERLAETGIRVVGARVVAIRPEPQVEQALQTPTRERLQQDADAATFERRANAVERERAISENELQNQIELARREEQLVAQRGANTRLQAQEAAAADEIQSTAQAERTRQQGAAEADSEAARLAAYAGATDSLLMSLALKELAANLPAIDSLVLTPDLLTPLLARTGAGGRPQES